MDKELHAMLNPLRHAEIAQALPPPTPLQPTPLTPTQIGNLEMMANQPQEYMEKVRAALQYWTQRKEALRDITRESIARLPTDKQATVGNIDLFLLGEIILRTGHEDKTYVPDLVEGFPVTGSISSGGLGTPLTRGATGPRQARPRRTRAYLGVT